MTPTFLTLIDSVKKLSATLPERPRIMEVCGTHTAAIVRYGLRDLLKDAIDLISGPGCPVCVTPNALIDSAVGLAEEGFSILTFGDMLRVPGSQTSLSDLRAQGADIRIITSPMDVLAYASSHPERQSIFFAVGFETTAPATARLLQEASDQNIRNLWILPGHKVIAPAMTMLLDAGEPQLSGFLSPGHVAVITGVSPFEAISRSYGIPCVIAGFEPEDILQSILMILRQLAAKTPRAEIQYTRAVQSEGNPLARRIMEEIFEPVDSDWRGIGAIPASGLGLTPSYRKWDALKAHGSALKASSPTSSDHLCLCGSVIRGLISPESCPSFASACNPNRPYGPCMVSSEGSCFIAYTYSDRR